MHFKLVSFDFIRIGSRWRVKQLTWSITKYPSSLKTADVDRELAKAFQVWADVTELTFVQLRTGKVHIEIRYVETRLYPTHKLDKFCRFRIGILIFSCRLAFYNQKCLQCAQLYMANADIPIVDNHALECDSGHLVSIYDDIVTQIVTYDDSGMFVALNPESTVTVMHSTVRVEPWLTPISLFTVAMRISTKQRCGLSILSKV